MKKLAIAAGIASILTLSACSSDGGSDVVAETGAGDITKQDFYDQMKDKTGSDVLRQMVTRKVLEDNYDVSDEDVNAQVKDTKDQLGDQFDMFLQQQGFKDEDAYRDTIRLSLLQLEAAAEDMDITKDDLKQRYNRMQTEIKAKNIVVDDEETAKKVEKKLDNGKNFDDLMEKYTSDKQTPQRGRRQGGGAQQSGELDYFTAGDLTPAIEDAAYNMDGGKVSDPIKSDYGYNIIKVTDKRDKDKDIGSFEDNKDKIRRNIINRRVDVKQLQKKIDGLIEDSDVNIKPDDLQGIFKKDDNKQQKSKD
ncbi:peptidylprolyl isomerase PrsA [Barrientosiimonas marina]|uniref:Foldase protein PrsA n=1 Tax=Lentibacillus kimchii TaxID=1542911 RepID=A0ABW2UT53_9BACI